MGARVEPSDAECVGEELESFAKRTRLWRCVCGLDGSADIMVVMWLFTGLLEWSRRV